MNQLASLASSFAVLTLVTTAASAQPEPEAPTQVASPPSDPAVAVTVSPLHMFVPMLELTAEVRVAPRVGVAIIGGVGVLRDVNTNDRTMIFEGGASARYYLTGSFRSGVQLGAEALYVHESANPSDVTVAADGLAMGPFVGYKWTHRTGLTLEAQLGVSYLTARAHADTGAMAGASDVAPILNLGAGWSF